LSKVLLSSRSLVEAGRGIKVCAVTRSAGLVAVHPIAEPPRDECFRFAWLLGREAFLRFAYDPDTVFSEKIDERGFGK